MNVSRVSKLKMNGHQSGLDVLAERNVFSTNLLHSGSTDQCVRLIDEYQPLCINLAALYAAENGQLESLKFLLNQGAEVNAKDTKGNSLLAKAVAYPACVDYLITLGADINVTDNDGTSALMKAVAGGYKRSVKILLNGKPFINTRNRYGFTALIQAAKSRRIICTKLLLDCSAEVNRVDKSGYSALVHAAAKQSVDCVKLLLSAGAVIDKNMYESVYCLLKSWETAIVNKQIILMLFAGGADIPQSNHREMSIYWKDLADCLEPYTCHEDMSLKQLSRTIIRNHLLLKHQLINLYFTIYKLGLPSPLSSYLLYNVVFCQ